MVRVPGRTNSVQCDSSTIHRKTIKSYMSWIRSLVLFFSPRHPKEPQNEDIRFLYAELYERKFVIESIPRPKRGKPLPGVLTHEEIKRMIDVTVNIKHKAVLMVSYSRGLRLSEVVNLTPADIDGKRKLVFIRGGKGRKDRFYSDFGCCTRGSA
jgi:integrase/recombinase XerD